MISAQDLALTIPSDFIALWKWVREFLSDHTSHQTLQAVA
jgi:hypothetical protein